MCKQSKETTEKTGQSTSTGSQSGTGTQTSSNTQHFAVPDYVTEANKWLVNFAKGNTEKSATGYGEPMVAGLNDTQKNVFQKLNELVSGGGWNTAGEAAQKAIAQYASAPAQKISTERIVDENGKLGKISDYLNPYTDAAINPTLRRIQEAADAERNQMKRAAISGSGFGDARHGVGEAVLADRTQKNVADAASTGYQRAYDTAMGLRSGDLARFTDVDKTNAGYNEQALMRALTGGKEGLAASQATQTQALQALQALLGAGNQQQQVEQSGLDAKYKEFLRQLGAQQTAAGGFGDILKNLQIEKSQTSNGFTNNINQMFSNGQTNSNENTTKYSPDNSWLKLLGALGGAALGSAPVSGAIAGLFKPSASPIGNWSTTVGQD